MSDSKAKVSAFFEACAKGDVEALGDLFAKDPSLVRAANPAAQHSGWTGLHTAAQGGHTGAVRLLIEHGADPNAREAGDNTTPLHWAAASPHLETVRALLDAGADVHGLGDVHELDVIGWATFFHAPGGEPGQNPEVASLLVERGARHHIFSAISVGDLDLIRTVVEQNPEALDRRMSRFEQGQTPLHLAITLKRYDILDLLIGLGADLEAKDRIGQTALEVSMLRGDSEATSRLQAAGATPPKLIDPSTVRKGMAKLADSITKGVPMIDVPDVARTLDWYTSIGFTELGRFPDGAGANWGMLSFGKAELMLNMGGTAGEHDASLWFYTDQIDQLYKLLKSRQGIEFVEEIYEPPYGGREFGIRDLNGFNLFFLQQP